MLPKKMPKPISSCSLQQDSYSTGNCPLTDAKNKIMRHYWASSSKIISDVFSRSTLISSEMIMAREGCVQGSGVETLELGTFASIHRVWQGKLRLDRKKLALYVCSHMRVTSM